MHSDIYLQEINDHYGLLAFVKLAARLMNDESTECRQMIMLAMQKLVVSVSESKRNDLYLATRDWLESKKASLLMIIILKMPEKCALLTVSLKNIDLMHQKDTVIFRKHIFVLPYKH